MPMMTVSPGSSRLSNAVSIPADPVPEARLLAVVHAETSTGVLQPLEELGAYLRGTETLYLVDTVTSLGGVPVKVDDWGIDVSYSGTQKCLSVPPGLAPVTLSDRAMNRVRTREHKVHSWYLDLSLIGSYWGGERAYHHTAPINALYGLHEGLRAILDEGLEGGRALPSTAACVGPSARGGG
jgi:alanine-glyoxylate transaminase/serine-glyoxylate transaminase/serine-pyruvate transaminase